MDDGTRYARRGMVCAVDHLAAEAGVAMLRAGGSAADAAIATNAVLAVTMQHMCGLGGDLVALVHPGGTEAPVALLGIGAAGSGSDAEPLRASGAYHLPINGDIRSVTVPACVDGWLALHQRFGRLPLTDVLAAAVDYATHGFPVSPGLAMALPFMRDAPELADYFVGGPPGAGDIRRLPGVARTLDSIATDGRDAFYCGEFGAALRAVGAGLYSESDLARDQAEWAAPLALDVGGQTLYATPAPTQGYLTLAAAAITERHGGAANSHLQLEALKVSGADRLSRLFDGADLAPALASEQLDAWAAEVDPTKARPYLDWQRGGDTIYLCAADADGQWVSLSQSLCSGWGSQIALDGLGIVLHNRGVGFLLERGHPNALAPGRRPAHTLQPILATEADGSAQLAIGTMGGDAQPQIVTQLLGRLAAGDTPGAAINAPRWMLAGAMGMGAPGAFPPAYATTVLVEDTTDDAWRAELEALGHPLTVGPAGGVFGHAHCIRREPGGALAGAADPRSGSSAAAGW